MTRARLCRLAWTCTRARVAQLTSFGAMKAGDLARRHEEDGNRLGVVRGRRFDYWTRSRANTTGSSSPQCVKKSGKISPSRKSSSAPAI